MLILVIFICLSGVVVSHNYADNQLECWEQTMCHQPDEYPNTDFIDEVNISGEPDQLWRGNIKIENVTFMHNFSEKIDDFSFEKRDAEDSKDKVIRFDGVIKTKSLCNEPIFDLDIVKSSKYKINVYGNDTYGVRSCYDHPVKVDYALDLQTETSQMEVVVNQSNTTESFQTKDYHGLPRGQGEIDENNSKKPEKDKTGDQETGERGFFSNISKFLENLF